MQARNEYNCLLFDIRHCVSLLGNVVALPRVTHWVGLQRPPLAFAPPSPRCWGGGGGRPPPSECQDFQVLDDFVLLFLNACIDVFMNERPPRPDDSLVLELCCHLHGNPMPVPHSLHLFERRRRGVPLYEGGCRSAPLLSRSHPRSLPLPHRPFSLAVAIEGRRDCAVAAKGGGGGISPEGGGGWSRLRRLPWSRCLPLPL